MSIATASTKIGRGEGGDAKDRGSDSDQGSAGQSSSRHEKRTQRLGENGHTSAALTSALRSQESVSRSSATSSRVVRNLRSHTSSADSLRLACVVATRGQGCARAVSRRRPFEQALDNHAWPSPPHTHHGHMHFPKIHDATAFPATTLFVCFGRSPNKHNVYCERRFEVLSAHLELLEEGFTVTNSRTLEVAANAHLLQAKLTSCQFVNNAGGFLRPRAGRKVQDCDRYSAWHKCAMTTPCRCIQQTNHTLQAFAGVCSDFIRGAPRDRTLSLTGVTCLVRRPRIGTKFASYPAAACTVLEEDLLGSVHAFVWFES